jgi:sugar phosphate isomerase/epimerase
MDKSKIVFSGNDDVYAGNLSKLIHYSNLFEINQLELWFPKTVSFESLDDVESKLIESGKKAVCITTWSHLYSEKYESEQDLVLRSLKIAKRLGSERVNTYFGHSTYNNPRRAIETYLKNVAPVVEAAENIGITICLENEFDSRGQDPGYSDITRSADLMLELLERINSPKFKITFDPANCYIAGEEAYPYFYTLLKKYIDYIHVKDVRKYVIRKDLQRKIWSDHERNYIFTPLGEGVINYFAIFKALRDDGYQGYFTIEPHIEKDDLLKDSYEKYLNFMNMCFDMFSRSI